jgi:hypothetical protein
MSVCPFDEPSNLSSPNMALGIFQAEGGMVREIMKLIHQASIIAVIVGKSKVTMQDFAQTQ